MNKTFITGRLTRDPEAGTTKAGINYARFTVAVRKRWHAEGEPDSDFFRITAWRGLGDTCLKYLRKSKMVAVVGTVGASCWTTDQGEARCQMEMDAESVEFLSTRTADEEAEDERG